MGATLWKRFEILQVKSIDRPNIVGQHRGNNLQIENSAANDRATAKQVEPCLHRACRNGKDVEEGK